MNNPFGGQQWPGGMPPPGPWGWAAQQPQQQWPGSFGYGPQPDAPMFYPNYFPAAQPPLLGDPDLARQFPFQANAPTIDPEAFYLTVTGPVMEVAKQELEFAEQQLQAGRGFEAVSFVTSAFSTVNRIISFVPDRFRPPELGDVVQSSMEAVADVARVVGASGFTIGGGMTAGVYFELQFDAEKMTTREREGETSE